MGLVDIDFMALVGAICMCDRGDRADGFDVFKKAGGEDFKCVQADSGDLSTTGESQDFDLLHGYLLARVFVVWD